MIKQYSSSKTNYNPPSQEQTLPPFLISNSLLHDVLLLESRSYTLKYAANQKSKLLKKIEELNMKIDEKARSIKPKDIEMVNVLKFEVQNIEDEKDMSAARKSFVRMQLEGEKPSKYFCSMNKKFWEKGSLKKSFWKRWMKAGKRSPE